MKNYSRIESHTGGLYIHIPFCEIRCGYCDFYTVTNREAQIPAYISALKNEMQIYADKEELQNLTFSTLFFGGGTPSLLSPIQIESIIECLRQKFEFSQDPEITLEANPGTVDLQKLRGLKSAGINRLSLGFQSFQKHELEFLDRDHTVEQATNSYAYARKAGFDNVSFDLIFALPGQEVRTWSQNLKCAVELQPEHISAYNLTFEDGTPLTTQLKKGRFKISPEESQRAMHLQTIEFLEQHGLKQYEISNYARPGFESRHNQKYWDYSPYLGLGASSHSFINKRRFWNGKNYVAYMDSLAKGNLAVSGDEKIDHETMAFEQIYLGLRQSRGVSLKNFGKLVGASLFEKYPKAMAKFFDIDPQDTAFHDKLENGDKKLASRFVVIANGYLQLTREGIVLSDAICAEFI